MKKFEIFGKTIEIDETIKYLDYHHGGPVQEIDFIRLFGKIEQGMFDTSDLEEWLRILSRWVNEAPRKRFYRDAQRKVDNFHVMSTENFFVEDENGGEIIDGLENTGKLAQRLRSELYGKDDLPRVEEYAISP